jgi:hypothetical protein
MQSLGGHGRSAEVAGSVRRPANLTFKNFGAISPAIDPNLNPSGTAMELV